MKADSKRLAVILEGGIVQDVVTDDPSLMGLAVAVIDYDVESWALGDNELTQIPQGDGTTQPAYVSISNPGKAAISLDEVFAEEAKG